jgi:hypothetical protein
VFARVRPFLVLIAIFSWAGFGLAAEPRPVVGPGASRDEVIDAYGWPSGQSQAGSKEVLTYPQGKVTLENGRVEKVDFSMTTPWPAPKPRPGPSAAVPPLTTEEQAKFWLTNFDEAAREAARRQVRILALFTGSDWSPASKQFLDDVAFQPEFIQAFMGDYVFLRLDFPTHTTQPAEVREQNARLRARYGVKVYPTLLVLSPAGEAVGQIDLNKAQPGETYRARAMAGVREVRALLAAQPVMPDPAKPATTTGAPAAATVREKPIARVLNSMGWTVMISLAAGLALAGVVLWFLWRKPVVEPSRPIADRIADAANGLPTSAQLAMWSHEKIRAVVAALAEADSYVVELQPAGSDKDLVLKQTGETQPRVMVCCAAGAGGPVSIKRVRELFGTLTVEGVPTGWFVSPAGFANDARTYAEQKGLVLIDGERLLNQLRNLPPMMLPKVLARTAQGRAT